MTKLSNFFLEPLYLIKTQNIDLLYWDQKVEVKKEELNKVTVIAQEIVVQKILMVEEVIDKEVEADLVAENTNLVKITEETLILDIDKTQEDTIKMIKEEDMEDKIKVENMEGKETKDMVEAITIKEATEDENKVFDYKILKENMIFEYDNWYESSNWI